MRNYIYRAREESGKLVSGEMTALNEDELARKLRGVGCMPTSIQEVASRTSPADARMPGPHLDLTRWRRIDPVQMIMFTIRLSSMIDGGIPLLRGLDISIRQTENLRLKRSLEGVFKGISGGLPFSEALARFPRTFSPLFINIVKSGEVSGNLKLVLSRYAQYLEQQEEIRQKIKNATFYPAVLLCVAMGIFLFMVTFIIPKFIDIFAKAGVELPLPTFVLY
ncbi:MAG: type II secretion system F family protein, partial [Candidatus Omnitrophica bacterium]|nr:type II secretion system F family protein [Candidatus Omnitrophota bacterium]